MSATPFFLRGSGYAEGTLFPWTMSDFSLMDAIECGIVKLPRVPVAENIPGNEMPMYCDLWENIRKDMPKKGRGKGKELDPLKLPTRLPPPELEVESCWMAATAARNEIASQAMDGEVGGHGGPSHCIS